tara:strand:- start:59 stop:433 length:375 start_codon:yes stop_codon:yes gene_type:complete
MSHFAEIDPDTKIVKRIIVAEQDFINSGTVGDSSNWIQTSYNTRGGVHYAPNTNTPDGGLALRKNYAGIGYIYDSGRDAFMVPQPFPSWTLNEDTCYWEAPTPYPVNGRNYKWNEETKSWEKIE